MLIWALCKKFWPGNFSINPYLATFGCLVLAVVTALILNVEFEGGLITGVIVFSAFSFVYSIALSTITFIYKSVQARKNA